MKTRAYSYVRWSSDRQTSGDSLRRQRELSAKYAAEHGLELDESLKDEGVSAFKGTNRRRGDLAIFLEQVEAGIIPRGSYLLVESLDRVSREQIVEAQTLFLQIINAGITLVTCLASRQTVYSKEAINNDPSLIIMAVFEMIRANEESAHKGDRVRSAHARRRALSRSDGKTFTRNLPGWISIDPETGERVLNEKAAIVRRVFELLADGMGRHSIVRMFNTATPPVQGIGFAAKWHASHIHHLIHGKTVLGEYQPCRIVWEEKPETKVRKRVPDGDPIKDYYPAAVSEDLYLRAHAAVAGNRVQVGRKGTKFNNLLLGMTRCGAVNGDGKIGDGCNCNMAYRDKGAKSVPYYICSGAERGICSNTRKYHVRWVEGLILEHVTDVHVEARPEDLRALDEQHAKLVRTLAERKVATQRLYDTQAEAMAAGVTLRGVVMQLAQAEEAEEEVSAAIRVVAEEIAAKRASSSVERMDFIRTVRQTMKEGTEAEIYAKRAKLAAALREIVDQVVFYPDGYVDMIILDGVVNYRFEPDGTTQRVEVMNPVTDVFSRGSTLREERLRKVMSQVR